MNKTRLRDLYGKLLSQKYQPIVREQRRKAALDLEKKIKRMVRDDPNFIKEIA